MARIVSSNDAAEIALVAAAVNGGVAVQHFAPFAGARQADAIIRTGNRREVQNDHGLIFAVRRLAQK